MQEAISEIQARDDSILNQNGSMYMEMDGIGYNIDEMSLYIILIYINQPMVIGFTQSSRTYQLH